MSMNIGDRERLVSGVVGVGLTLFGLKRGGPLGFIMTAMGAGLIARGSTGTCPLTSAAGVDSDDRQEAPWNRSVQVTQSVTISRPRSEVFAFWRNFANLPRFMNHLEEVREIDARTSDWRAKAPAGRQVCWRAEIVNEVVDELITWRSMEGADVENHGEVTFHDAPGGRGTIVRVSLRYHPPAGALGAIVAKFFGEEPKGQIADDLRRLRAILETGEVPTTKGQPSDLVRNSTSKVGSAPGAAILGRVIERNNRPEVTVR